MDLVTFAAATLSSLVVGMLGQQLYDASPRLARWCLKRAAARLSPQKRKRYSEEWAAHSEECLGKLGRISHALGCLFASYRIETPAVITNGRQFITLYFLEKVGFWLLKRRARLLNSQSDELSRSEIKNDDYLRAEFDKFLEYTVKIHLIQHARKQIWKNAWRKIAGSLREEA